MKKRSGFFRRKIKFKTFLLVVVLGLVLFFSFSYLKNFIFPSIDLQKSVVYVKNNNLLLKDLEKNKERRLLRSVSVSYLTLSPDGEDIYFEGMVNNIYGIYNFNLNSKKLKSIEESKDNLFIPFFVYFDRVLYLKPSIIEKFPTSEYYLVEIKKVYPDGGNKETLMFFEIKVSEKEKVSYPISKDKEIFKLPLNICDLKDKTGIIVKDLVFNFNNIELEFLKDLKISQNNLVIDKGIIKKEEGKDGFILSFLKDEKKVEIFKSTDNFKLLRASISSDHSFLAFEIYNLKKELYQSLFFDLNKNSLKSLTEGKFESFPVFSHSTFYPELTKSEISLTGIIDTLALKLRERPTTASSTLTVLRKNEQFEVLGFQGGWLKTSYKGKTGYLFGAYLKIKEKSDKTFSFPFFTAEALKDLNVYNNTKQEISLEKVLKGDRIIITNVADKFYKVYLPSGIQGYVLKEDLKLVSF